MTPKREAEIRRLLAEHWHEHTSQCELDCPDDAYRMTAEILAELDALRAKVERLRLDVATRERVVRLLGYSDGEAKSVAYSNVLDKGRELGLWK